MHATLQLVTAPGPGSAGAWGQQGLGVHWSLASEQARGEPGPRVSWGQGQQGPGSAGPGISQSPESAGVQGQPAGAWNQQGPRVSWSPGSAKAWSQLGPKVKRGLVSHQTRGQTRPRPCLLGPTFWLQPRVVKAKLLDGQPQTWVFKSAKASRPHFCKEHQQPCSARAWTGPAVDSHPMGRGEGRDGVPLLQDLIIVWKSQQRAGPGSSRWPPGGRGRPSG